MRVIDADELKVQIHSRCDVCNDKDTAWCEHCCSVNDWEDYIDNAPTVEERPKGKWYYNYQNGWHCSICNKSVKDMPTVMGKADFNFCPNCGADMRGDV